jgi:mono/diheme cytochrome c family protein
LAALACLFGAPQASAFPWSIDMYRGPEVQPMTVAPRVMPEGTLPINRGEPPITLEQAAVGLHNPLQPTADRIATGKTLYATQCAVCHGASGSGDGSVVHLLRKRPEDLTGSESSTWSDGFIYGVIRNGYGYMSPMGDALTPNERWAVVLFVRTLRVKSADPRLDTDFKAQAAGK